MVRTHSFKLLLKRYLKKWCIQAGSYKILHLTICCTIENMNVLIIGGTIFLGWLLVDATLVDSLSLTLFNRGQHNHNTLRPSYRFSFHNFWVLILTVLKKHLILTKDWLLGSNDSVRCDPLHFRNFIGLVFFKF